MDNSYIKGIDKLVERLNAAQRYLQNDLPAVISVEAVNHFKNSFINEGFTDQSIQKWMPRKSKRFGGTNNQPTGTYKGELADSIEAMIQGNSVVIFSDKPYAKIHNEGGTISVTEKMANYFWNQYYKAKEADNTELMDQFKAMALAKTIKIVQRKFIGYSSTLQNKITDKAIKDLLKVLQS